MSPVKARDFVKIKYLFIYQKLRNTGGDSAIKYFKSQNSLNNWFIILSQMQDRVDNSYLSNQPMNQLAIDENLTCDTLIPLLGL